MSDAVLSQNEIDVLFSVRDTLFLRVGDPCSQSAGNKREFLCRPGVIGKKFMEFEQNEIEEFAPGRGDIL